MRRLNTNKCSINQNAMLSDRTTTSHFKLFIEKWVNSWSISGFANGDMEVSDESPEQTNS